MAKRAQGYVLYPDPRTGIYLLRFRHNGLRRCLSTRTSDPGEAEKTAPAIYAEAVSGRRGTGGVNACSTLEVAVPCAKWLVDAEAELDKSTIDQYTVHGRHWQAFFQTVDRITPERIEDYWRARLREVTRTTVRKELSSLRRFLEWCEGHGFMNQAPTVRPLRKGATGTRDTSRPHKLEPTVLTEKEAAAVIRRMPEWLDGPRCKAPFPVRARFEVAWETALRPATLDKIRAPGDWKPGRLTLRIRDEIDKARFGRELPLTARAIAALGRVAPKVGAVFGKHDYRGAIERASALAVKAGQLPPDKRISPYDFRHSRLTAAGATTTSLLGLQFLAGHKHASTTARYLHAGAKEAAEVLRAAGGEVPSYRDTSGIRTPAHPAPRRPRKPGKTK